MKEYLVGKVPFSETEIMEKESLLRDWFTRGCDPIHKVIDGLDIGWGGMQRWATGRMPLTASGKHLDFACGYATFLAQLGWRFPSVRLIGLNVDFTGPHASARPLLAEAGVAAMLVQADARRMPFVRGSIDSVSCFLGLQDIEIGFGDQGIRETVAEAVRVLRPGGILVLIDEYPLDRFDEFLNGLPVTVIDHSEQQLDIHWDQDVATTAVSLYAEGWVAQMRLPEDDEAAHQAAYREALTRMEAKVATQIARQGYYVPFGPVRMIIGRKERNPL